MESSIEHFETPLANISALKSSLEKVHFNLSNIEEEILNLCDEDGVEEETMKVLPNLFPV